MSENATVIGPHLAVGSFTAIPAMQADGWRCLCLSGGGKDYAGIEFIPMNDSGGNNQEKIEKAIRWILDVWRSGGKAYVCCRHGMNRSVSIAAAAMTLAGKKEWFSNALTTIHQHRPVAGPRDDTMVEILLVTAKMKGLSKIPRPLLDKLQAL